VGLAAAEPRWRAPDSLEAYRIDAMPRRRNLFQDVVAIIHLHMAGGAVVEESAMLRNRLTGEEREVDVVVRSQVAGHPVTVSVEATSGSRRATVEWVERMVGKHRNLPTDRLVLVAEGGFTTQARMLAERENAIALAPEDIEGPDAAAKIVGRLKSLWPKLLALTPERFRVNVERPDGTNVWFQGLPDNTLFTEDGTPVAYLNDTAHHLIRKRFPEIADQIGMNKIADDLDRWFVLETAPHGTTPDGRVSLFVQYAEVDPPELHRVVAVVIEGKAHIEVRELQLRHMRLGDVQFSQGEVELAGIRSLVVVTEDSSGGKLTVRQLPKARAHKKRN
jgi:(2Fe-2S) ferredoxin